MQHKSEEHKLSELNWSAQGSPLGVMSVGTIDSNMDWFNKLLTSKPDLIENMMIFTGLEAESKQLEQLYQWVQRNNEKKGNSIGIRQGGFPSRDDEEDPNSDEEDDDSSRKEAFENRVVLEELWQSQQDHIRLCDDKKLSKRSHLTLVFFHLARPDQSHVLGRHRILGDILKVGSHHNVSVIVCDTSFTALTPNERVCLDYVCVTSSAPAIVRSKLLWEQYFAPLLPGHRREHLVEFMEKHKSVVMTTTSAGLFLT